MPLFPAMSHSPVTAATIALSCALSFLIQSPSWTRRLPNLLLRTTFPFGVFPNSAVAGTVCLLLFFSRWLERRQGSARFFMYCLLSSIITMFFSVALSQLLPGHREKLVRDAFGAWAGFVSALGVKYILDLPPLPNSTGQRDDSAPASPRPLYASILADKWPFLLVWTKIVVLDAVYVMPPVPYAVTYQISMSLSGVLVGLLLRQFPKLTHLLDRNATFRSLTRLISSVLAIGGASRFESRHARVDPQQQQIFQHHPGQGGADAFEDQEMAAALAASLQDAHGSPQSPPNRSSQPAIPNIQEKIGFIMELGLGCSEEEARQALIASQGNVDAATEVLISRM